jgi:hypothetical protein
VAGSTDTAVLWYDYIDASPEGNNHLVSMRVRGVYQFRKLFPSVQSFLMDRDTLLAYSQYWVKEEKPSEAIPKNLTNEEYSLYNALRSNLFGESVRLEQEFISFDRVCKYRNNQKHKI